MPRAAKIRIVGTLTAIPLSILWFGTAISQSTVSNTQVQGADVVGSLNLNVETNDSDTSAVTTATGNSFVGSTVSGGLDVESSQTLSGNVSASTVVNIDQTPGPTYESTTAATGNSGDSVISSTWTMTGNLSQTTTSASVDAESQTNGDNAYTTDATQTVQAVANGQQFGAEDSSLVANVNQSNAAAVTANGGAVFNYVADQGVFNSTAAGNDLTSTASGQVTQNLDVNQTNTGGETQATMFVNLGNAELSSTSATAAGNDIDASNTEGALFVTDGQTNQSFVNAQAVETSYEFGAATVQAEGVGNTMVAANIGPNVGIDNTQVNGGADVDATASFQGNNGYDVAVSSSATGNAATGFACSTCGGTMNVYNSQTNTGGVGATTTVAITGGARSVSGVATAVGNTATYYVSKPN
jgi:hypothetical protein